MAKDILKGAASIASGGLLGLVPKLAASVASPRSTTAPTPAPGPIVMPIADDEAVKRARKRSIAAQLQRGGRSSTILTDSTDKLGS